jgi:NAD(P)-dependent dehydrogenase (short-subunit alcohol dehydrogenase family)
LNAWQTHKSLIRRFKLIDKLLQIFEQHRVFIVTNNPYNINFYHGPLENMASEVFVSSRMLNLTGKFHALKYEIQAMKHSGGSIINTASTAGIKGVAQGIAAYVAAKHGVIGLTKASALEQAHNQIRVNALVKSAMATKQWQKGIEKKNGYI